MRKFLFISSGILFIAAAVVLILAGIDEKGSYMLSYIASSIPFAAAAYWNFYTVFIESKIGSDAGYYTFKTPGNIGIAAQYSKHTVVPMVLSLIISISIAVICFFAAAGKEEVLIIILGSVSLTACLLLAIIYTARINKALYKNQPEVIEDLSKSGDEEAFKIAFFFASVATLGLFAVGYYIYKALKNKS